MEEHLHVMYMYDIGGFFSCIEYSLIIIIRAEFGDGVLPRNLIRIRIYKCVLE